MRCKIKPQENRNTTTMKSDTMKVKTLTHAKLGVTTIYVEMYVYVKWHDYN